MSRIRANTIVNSASTGAPTFPNGAVINGISTITADVTLNTAQLNGTDADFSGIGTYGVVSLGTGTSISSPSDNVLTLGTNDTEALRITANGDTQVSSGSSLYITNGNLVFSTSGTGIDFQSVGVSSTTATSHILDDYEEGTWTIKAGSTYGSQPDTSGFLQEGSYVKIGKVVTLYINFNYNDSATSVAVDDYLVIYGIPFVTGGGTVTSVGSAWQYRGISTGNNAFWVVGGALYTSTNLYLGCTHVDGSVVYDRNIRAWVTYTVNA